MKKLFRTTLIIAIVILSIWIGLTIWVEIPKGNTISYFGEKGMEQHALIVYNPDPIYNLDKQICDAFAQELALHNIYTTVTTIKMARSMCLNEQDYDVYVFCANTYNWRPDWPTNNYIKEGINLKGKKVIALTLGSGSTKESKAAFEKTINNTGAKLIDSKTLWLLRPNDESRMNEKNVNVAISITKEWAKHLATILL